MREAVYRNSNSCRSGGCHVAAVYDAGSSVSKGHRGHDAVTNRRKAISFTAILSATSQRPDLLSMIDDLTMVIDRIIDPFLVEVRAPRS